MSHFSTVKTELRQLEPLVKALEDMGYAPDQGERPVRGYRGQTVTADLAPVRAVDAAQDRHLVARTDGADHAMLDARAGPDVQIRGNGGHRLRRGGPRNRQGSNEGRNKIRFHGNLLSLGHAAL